jgi:hypothetical protein
MIWFADDELTEKQVYPDELPGTSSSERQHSDLITIKVGFCPECVQRIEFS